MNHADEQQAAIAASRSKLVLNQVLVACIGVAASAAVSAVNIVPQVSLDSPANNSSFVSPGVLVLKATASDSDGTITKVQFYDGTTLLGSDTTWPYTFSWSNPAVAVHKITARATDNRGAVSTSAIVTLTAQANTPPSVSLLTPATNVSLVAPAALTLTSSAADSDGVVTKVAYYNGTTLVGSATSAPWSVAWTGASAGMFTFTAKATDDKGAVTSSAARTVTLTTNQTPGVNFVTPVNNAVYAAPASIALSVNASDRNVSINLKHLG